MDANNLGKTRSNLVIVKNMGCDDLCFTLGHKVLTRRGFVCAKNVRKGDIVYKALVDKNCIELNSFEEVKVIGVEKKGKKK